MERAVALVVEARGQGDGRVQAEATAGTNSFFARARAGAALAPLAATRGVVYWATGAEMGSLRSFVQRRMNGFTVPRRHFLETLAA